mgnify:CR=1 FL=1
MNEVILKFIEENLPENGDSGDIADVCRLVVDKFGIRCGYIHVNAFDSPPCNIEYYAIIFVDKEGDIDFYPHRRVID